MKPLTYLFLTIIAAACFLPDEQPEPIPVQTANIVPIIVGPAVTPSAPHDAAPTLVNVPPVEKPSAPPKGPTIAATKSAPQVKWQLESDARHTKGRVFVSIVSFGEPRWDKACRAEQSLFANPSVVAASQGIACTQLCWCEEKDRPRISAYIKALTGFDGMQSSTYPLDLVISPEGRIIAQYWGQADTAAELAARLRFDGSVSPAPLPNPRPLGPQRTILQPVQQQQPAYCPSCQRGGGLFNRRNK